MHAPLRSIFALTGPLLPLSAEPPDLLISTSEGIIECQWENGLPVTRMLSEHRVGWLASADGFLVAATELPDRQPTSGGAALFRWKEDGTLARLDEHPSEGRTACFVDLAPDGTVLVANFRHDRYESQGSLTTFRIAEDQLERVGRFTHPGKGGSDSNRQLASHPHSVVLDPSGRWAAIGDLGTDEVHLYELGDRPGELSHRQSLRGEPGQQPRHVRWHPDGGFLYCMNEAKKTVSVLRFDPEAGSLEFIQHLERDGGAGADLVVRPPIVYGSNRGPDTISCYRIEGESGELTLLDHRPAGGEGTRSLAVSEDGRWLVAAHQGSDKVSVLPLGDDGLPDGQARAIEVPGPACVILRPSKP